MTFVICTGKVHFLGGFAGYRISFPRNLLTTLNFMIFKLKSTGVSNTCMFYSCVQKIVVSKFGTKVVKRDAFLSAFLSTFLIATQITILLQKTSF